MHDVDKVLSTHMLSENTTTKESDEDELAGNQAGFDLNMEEFSSDFNASVLEDSQMKNDETIPATQVQNVQENILHEQSIPFVDHMSANPETFGYIKRQKDGKTKKKIKLLMIELLQKVMLIDAWISQFKSERVFQRKRNMFSSSQSEGSHPIRYTFICTIINMMIE